MAIQGVYFRRGDETCDYNTKQKVLRASQWETLLQAGEIRNGYGRTETIREKGEEYVLLSGAWP